MQAGAQQNLAQHSRRIPGAPDGHIHSRDSRLEWLMRHGFIDSVAHEFHAGKMMFPPAAA
jgi:hypothetical protein